MKGSTTSMNLTYLGLLLILITGHFPRAAEAGQLTASTFVSRFVSTVSRLLRYGARLLPRPSAAPVFVGGDPVHSRREFGYAARIVTRLSEYNARLCSGALVHPEWVITAAHCVTREGAHSDEPPLGIDVYLGDLTVGHLEPGEQQMTAWAEVHPDYQPRTRRNDVALLRLTRPAKIDQNTFAIPVSREIATFVAGGNFSVQLDADLQPGNRSLFSAPMDTVVEGEEEEEEEEEEAAMQEEKGRLVFAGWGRTGNYSSEPISLKAAQVEELEHNECARVLSSIGFAGRMHGSSTCFVGSKKDACFGDDGGPVVKISPSGKITLVAIHSTYAAPSTLRNKLLSSVSVGSVIAGLPISITASPSAGDDLFGSAAPRCDRGSPNVATRIAPYVGFVRNLLASGAEDVLL